MAEVVENILDQQIEEELKQSYLTYAMSVIVSRALPDVRDGLKPSQRRILVAMNDLNLGPRSKHRKCAKIVGDTSGNYHPHGDQATYGTLVRLGQSWAMRYPLVHPQGNFGSLDGDPPAAMRYTEARMAAPAVEMLEDLERQTVDFRPNYDETRTEPVVLPAKLPNLLINGTTGIAVGMSCNMPPHNLGEVCDAIVAYINDPNISYGELLKIIPGPDFPTGGMICGRKGVIKGYTTGRGSVSVRAKLHTETTRKGKKRIIVDEIPYQIYKKTIVEHVAAAIKKGTLPEVTNVNDESDRTGMRIAIDMRKEADENVVINQLYHITPLQSNVSMINIALVDGWPRTLTLKDMIRCYVDHRRDVLRRRTLFLLRRARNRAHILEGLILAIADIDEIIALIKASPDAPTAKEALMKKPLRLTEEATLRKALPEAFIARAGSEDQFLSGPQADAILAMQLHRLTGLEIEKLGKEYAALCEEIEGYEALLANEELILDIIREDLYELKEKHGNPRRTEIVGEAGDFDIEDLIAEEEMIVTVSHAGYVKRLPIDTYRTQGRGGRGVAGMGTREGDFIEHLFVASTHDYLLVFTNTGRCYWQRVYDIPQMSRTSRGRAVANLLKFQPGEALAEILPVREFDDRHVIFATAGGQIKKTALIAYSNPRRGGIAAITLTSKDRLIGVALTSGENEIILGTRRGMAIRFSEADVRAMGRNARGVRGINLREGDNVVDMAIVDPTADMLTVCEQGFGKRTPYEDYRVQSRGGLGLINIKASERNGKVVGLQSVRDTDDVMCITANGIVIRMPIAPIRPIGRNTQGVRMVRLDDADRVVALAPVVKEDTDDKEKP